MLESDGLWRRTIRVKFGTKDLDWFTRISFEPHGFRLWKDMHGEGGISEVH